MPNDEITKKKRKINARITALRSVGKSDDEIADAVLSFDDLSDSMRSKIKNAKAVGRSKDILSSIESSSQVTEPTTQADDFEVGGALGKTARFLGIEKAGRRIGATLAKIDPQHRRNLASLSEEEAKTIGTGGVNNREFAGSLGNTALNLAGGALIKGGAKALGVGARTLNPAQKASRTVGTIARNPIKTGAAFGAAEGYTQALNDDKRGLDVAKSVGTGAALGGAIGAIPGVKRLLTGEKLPQKQIQKAMETIAPDVSELTPTQYQKLLKEGRITPRTATKPAQVQLSDKELAAVARHPDVIDADPVRTTIKLSEKIGEIDNQVADFLLENNVSFKKSELSSKINKAMSSIDDVSVPKERIAETTEKMIKNFDETIDESNMYGLWQARKQFDQKIERAFSGSPTLQKEMKIAFRNAVQDFVAEKTPNKTYKGFMNDMSSLYNVYDLAETSARRQKNYSSIGQYFKARPALAKALGFGVIAGGGAIVGSLATRTLPNNE